ncbi:MAG: DUF4145 domain-containing protein [Candidatus Aminicenantales bacterium]
MHILLFILGLVKALAWPVTVLSLVLLFRHQLRKVFASLSQLKYGDWEARFEKDLSKAEEGARQISVSTGKKPDITKLNKYERLLLLAEISPRAAIMEAWMEIELSTLRAAQKAKIDVEGRIAGTRHIRQLVQSGLLPGTMVELYSSLRWLRNQAAHAEDFAITEDEAERYLSVASTIIAKLNESSQNSQ